MPTFKWTIHMDDYKQLRCLQYRWNKVKYKEMLRDIEKNFINRTKAEGIRSRRDEIMSRKYYEGFNTGREQTMFKEELEDLEIVYKTALKNYAKEVEEVLPSLLYFMEKFLIVHKQNEAIREKLEDLLAKTGRQECDECDGGDDE